MNPGDNFETTDFDQNDWNSYRIRIWSWILILFLCVLWPLSILIVFNPPDDPDLLEKYDPILRFYLPTIIFQLAVLAATFMVSRAEGSALSSLGYSKFEFIHLVQAIAFIIVASLLLRLVGFILQQYDLLSFKSPEPLLPRTLMQKTVWIMLCIIVAVTEETTYRGYLITRLSKISGSTILAIIVSCLGFSAGHLYQGSGGAILLFFYGLMFALLYLGTRSLWPCIIAHFIHNALAPLFVDKIIVPL